MALSTNTAEITGGTNGMAVVSNSQPGTGTSFTVTLAQGGTITLDNTVKHRGSFSYKCTAAVAGQVARADQAFPADPNFAAEPYFYFGNGYPDIENRLMEVRSDLASVSYINIMPSGLIRLYTAASAVLLVWTSTSPVPLNQWWRAAMTLTKGGAAGTGTLKFRVHQGANADSATPSEEYLRTGNADLGVNDFTIYRRGKVGSGNGWTLNFDDDQWNPGSAAFIGPVSSAPPVLNVSTKNIREYDTSQSSLSGAVLSLTQSSGPTVTITGPVNGKFTVEVPSPMNTAAVLDLVATPTVGSPVHYPITISPSGGSVTVLERIGLTNDGAGNWVL
jgi:hypothetical protein